MKASPFQTHLKLFLLVTMLFVRQVKAFLLDNSWENVTYVPALSENAKKDNEFFDQDSFNEVSYTITRPIDITNGSVFSRPTFITQIIAPQVTSVVRSYLNHTQKRYALEETPYFYSIGNLKTTVTEQNIEEKTVYTNSTNESANLTLSQENDTIKNSEEHKKPDFVNFKGTEMKNKKKRNSNKLNKLTREVRELNKQTGFLVKSLKELKTENDVLKKKLKTKEFTQKRLINRRRKEAKTKISKPRHFKKARRTRLHSPKVKKRKSFIAKKSLLEKMKRFEKIELFFSS